MTLSLRLNQFASSELVVKLIMMVYPLPTLKAPLIAHRDGTGLNLFRVVELNSEFVLSV